MKPEKLAELSAVVARLDERTLGMQTDITDLKTGISETNINLNKFIDSADNKYAGKYITKAFWALFAGMVSFISYVSSRGLKL